MFKYMNYYELNKTKSNLERFILLKKRKINQKFNKLISEELSFEDAINIFNELDNISAYVNKYIDIMKKMYLTSSKLSEKSSKDLILLLELNNKELNDISINEFVKRRKKTDISKLKKQKLSYEKAINIYLNLFLDDFFLNKESKLKRFRKIFESYLLKQGLTQDLYELIDNVEDMYENKFENDFQNFNSMDVLDIIYDILSSKSLKVDIIDMPDLLMYKSIPNSKKHFTNIWTIFKDNVDIDYVNEMYAGDCYQYVYDNYNESGSVLCVQNCVVNNTTDLQILNYMIYTSTRSHLNYVCYENNNAYLVLSDIDMPCLSFLLIFIALVIK